MLAKVHRPDRDIRKPFTEIGDPDTYSGRTHDEKYITDFVIRYQLPCNITTAFLTPAFRTFNQALLPGTRLSGKPRKPYDAVLQLLQLVQNGTMDARTVLIEIVRQLILLRDERQQQINALLQVGIQPHLLTVEAILDLIKEHLKAPRSSRLPVLIITAAYEVAQNHLGKRLRPLQPHTAADTRTGTLGDLEIISQDSQQITIVYEMKTRSVTYRDIENARKKITNTSSQIDQYVFVTTAPIDAGVLMHASMLTKQIGVEFMVLDCLEFIKHFLHLFYELRAKFLDRYQQLILSEPESAVSYELKRKFLELRNALAASRGSGSA